MPRVLPTADLDAAKAAVVFAQQVRKHHARRTEPDSLQRQEDIAGALARIAAAMAPLRSAIGGFPYGPQTRTAERNRQTIRAASESLQKERRKLSKMKRSVRV